MSLDAVHLEAQLLELRFHEPRIGHRIDVKVLACQGRLDDAADRGIVIEDQDAHFAGAEQLVLLLVGGRVADRHFILGRGKGGAV